jgi:hypothetical protein
MKMKTVLTGGATCRKAEAAVFALEPLHNLNHSVFRVLLGGKWYSYKSEPEWMAVGLGFAQHPSNDELIVVAGSSEGDLWELQTTTSVERLSRIPGDYRGITKYAAIDQTIWACGMGRIVLRRNRDGSWTNTSAPKPALDEGVIGFTAIAGSPTGEIFTVGWKGEVWILENGVWAPQDTGTSANLNAVSIGPDGRAVVVGDNGMLIVGARDQWSVVDVGIGGNLQGVCHFGEEIFVCTDFELFLFDGKTVSLETRFGGGDTPKTCMNLIVCEKFVLSQGERDIFKYSGKVWERVF